MAACINVNRLKGNIHWRKVFKLPPQEGKNDTLYISLSCNHCENPACTKACPTAAMHVQEQDTIVVHEPDQCLGCRYCQMACPYDAIEWLADEKVVGKCMMCQDRLKRGEKPACVSTCFSGALTLITITKKEQLVDLVKELMGFEHVEAVKPRIRFKTDEQRRNHDQSSV